MKHPKIHPVGDHILIRFEARQEQVQGGVIIPDSATEKPQHATVVALGTGCRSGEGVVTPFDVKVGDAVLVAKYGGAEVNLAGEKYTFVRQDDILGVIG